ncbi:MFS transporter [Sorangium sp. So ce394]|uniref:MFS transporter n=1 Tax=Sorangium sp. So ce394 TaxID=3133310 RepID=UPI003F5BC578
MAIVEQRMSQFPLLVAVFASYVARGAFLVAASWELVRATGAVNAVGWLLVWQSAADIAVGPFLGIVIDRWDRKRISMAADAGRGALLLLLFLAWSVDLAPSATAMIYTFGILSALGDRLFMGSVYALVMEIAPEHELLRFNSRTASMVQLGNMLGAGVGGVVVASIGYGASQLVSAVCFFISPLALSRLSDRRARPAATSARAAASFRDALMEGVAALQQSRGIQVNIVLQATLIGLLSVTNTLLPGFVAHTLERDGSAYGVIDAAGAVGAMVGAALFSAASSQALQRFSMRHSLLLLCLSTGAFSLSRGLAGAAVLYAAIGLCIVTGRVSADCDLQQRSGVERIGRIKNLVQVGVAVLSGVLYLNLGAFGHLASPAAIYRGYAVFLGVVWAGLSITAFRRSSHGVSR